MELYSFNHSKKFRSLDSCLNDSFALLQSRRDHEKINPKNLIPFTYAYVNTSLGKARPVKVRALLDSGGTATIMRKALAKKLRVKKSEKTTWSKLAGKISTASATKVWFALPEFLKIGRWNTTSI